MMAYQKHVGVRPNLFCSWIGRWVLMARVMPKITMTVVVVGVMEALPQVGEVGQVFLAAGQ